MNRLTKKHHDDTTNIVDTFSIKEINWCDSTMENWDSAYTGEPIDKLSEYEDIGLTPDEIKYFLKDFGISLLMENRVLKKQHEEDEEIINKMAKRLKSFGENTFNSGWIPVSERLPSDMQRVSVTLENEMVLEVFYINDKFKFIETFKGGGMEEVYKDNPVIAWQPLPEPYNRRNEIGD